MHLEGIGSSTSTITNSSHNNGVSQVGSGENMPKVEMRTIPRSSSNSQDRGPVIKEKRYSEEELIDMVGKANKEFIAYDRKFQYFVHEKTKQTMIRVVDSVTDEIIKEIPPERLLDIIAGIWEVAGIIVDKKI